MSVSERISVFLSVCVTPCFTGGWDIPRCELFLFFTKLINVQKVRECAGYSLFYVGLREG